MTTSNLEAETVLAIDIGSIHTRGLLFDLVAGQYRFIGASCVPSTEQAPFFDISEGIYQAVVSLEELTARIMLEDGRLIMPSDPNGRGFDHFVITFSTPRPLKVAILGLLEDVSMESARKLINSMNSQIVEQIGINDNRKISEQIDALVKANPDLILIAGGTDNGASRSIARLVELISLTVQVIARENRPEVLYAGNQALAKQV